MSIKLDPREILEYLNELGYTNITAQQLKAFMIGNNQNFYFITLKSNVIIFLDLKTLIKYDQKQAEKENIPNLNYVKDVTTATSQNNLKSKNVQYFEKAQPSHTVQVRKENPQSIQCCKQFPINKRCVNRFCTCGKGRNVSPNHPQKQKFTSNKSHEQTHMAPTVSSRARSKAGSDFVAITECDRPKTKTNLSVPSELSNFPVDTKHFPSSCTFETSTELYSHVMTNTDTVSKSEIVNVPKQTRSKSALSVKPKVSCKSKKIVKRSCKCCNI